MPVRVFCFIFVVQIITLLAQPCEEVFPNVLEEVLTIAQASNINGGSAEEAKKDECSPFCICSCCSHPMTDQIYSFAITTQPKQFVKAISLAEYINPYSANHSESIWQPPKA